MKNQFSIFILLFISLAWNPFRNAVHAQGNVKPWTLQQCIDHALNNNLQIRQNLLNLRLASVTLVQAKAQLLPSLNANASQSYNNGKKVDPFTNSFTTGEWSSSQNFSLSTSITLFGGFQNLNSVKQAQYDQEAAFQDVAKMKNDVSLNIASAYLQILFAQELVEAAKSQAEVSKLQADRTKKLVEAGNLAKGSLLDLEAQLAMEEVNVVNAENTLSLSLLNLTQMLNLDTVVGFNIATPDIAPPVEVLLGSTSAQIYDVAVTRQPEIKSAEFKLKSSEKALGIARGGRLPRLSLSASYGTGYSSVSQHLANTPSFLGFSPSGDITSSGDTVLSPLFSKLEYATTPFKDQIDQNLSRSVGFYLTVPIFNNLQTHASVTRAKISRESALLSLQMQKDVLRKTIQQAFNDASSSLKKYQASRKAVSAMDESFKYMDQRYLVGVVTATDYNDAKNKLAKAKSDLLQSKYDYVFKLKVLDFYLGKPISL